MENFDWIGHLITALLGGGLATIVTLFKVKADNRATNASAAKTETEAGSEIIEQAQAVVQMWRTIGQELQTRVDEQAAQIKSLEDRLCSLEASEKAKRERISQLEAMNKAKDKRILELEREVERLQGEIDELKRGRGE